MNLIEQGKFYKADILIDIFANVHKEKIFRLENGRLRFFNNIDSQEVIELKDAIVFPSPVNAHTHLELSGIDKSELNFSSFTDWAISIIKTKRKRNEKELLDYFFKGLNQLKDYATVCYGNIISPFLFHKIPKNEQKFNFVEIIGYDEELIDSINIDFPKISAHSFFSVHPLLIKKIFSLNRPVSMHFFESKDELDYLLYGKGNIPKKLYKFVGLKPLKYSIDFFIDFLSNVNNVQLVHLSNLPEQLKNLIIKRKNELIFTLCPRSNVKLGITPPLYFFIKNNIPFSLGTDSLCSNDDLNVLNEGKFIFENMRNDFEESFLLKNIFFSLTTHGYKAIGSSSIEYAYIESPSIDKNESFSYYFKVILMK